MIPTNELKVGDIVWLANATGAHVFFVSTIKENGDVEVSRNKPLKYHTICSNQSLFRSYIDLYNDRFQVVVDKYADAELQRVASQAYNAGAGTPLSQPDIERLNKVFDQYRKNAESVLLSDPLLARDETADLPPVTFAEAMMSVTKTMKELGDTLGSVNPCDEMLESTPPDTDSNEFEGMTIPSCPECNVVDTKFLPGLKIGAWARGECVCNYIKSRSHYTREGNFIGSRENFNKTVLSGAQLAQDKEMKAMREAAEGDNFTPGYYFLDGPIPEITLSDLSDEEFPPRENFLTKEEAKKMWDEAGGCDCGGPDGHLPGGSHCRKPL